MTAQLSEMNATDPTYFELSTQLQNLSGQVDDRRNEVRGSSHWTEQDDRTLEANQSLKEKSAQVANMMKGSGIE